MITKRSTRLENLENENFLHGPQNMEKVNEEKILTSAHNIVYPYDRSRKW